MASATARRKSRFDQPRGTYGNLAYAQPAARPLEQDGAEILRPQPKVRPRERALTRPKVRVRQAGEVSPFAVVGFLTVAVFAVLLMLSHVRLTMVSDEVVSLRDQLSDLQSEEAKLMAEYELTFDPSAIEERVLSDGSMVKPTADQIYTLDLSEDDNVVHYDQDAQGTGFLDAVGEIVDNALSYFR